MKQSLMRRCFTQLHELWLCQVYFLTWGSARNTHTGPYEHGCTHTHTAHGWE